MDGAENPAFQDIPPDLSDHPDKNGNIAIENVEAITDEKDTSDEILYGIDDTPAWYLSILLGLQQYLTSFGSSLAVPFILAPAMCIGPDDPSKGYLLSTIIFVSGIVTLIQATFGVRLPIIQGGTFSLLVPTLAILSLDKWKCPEVKDENIFSNSSVNGTETRHDQIWHSRMLEIQGAIIVASLVEVLIGISGVMGVLINYITPLTIAPTVTLVGLSLFPVAAAEAGKHWGISFMVLALIAIFSQYLRNVNVPLPSFSKNRGCHFVKVPIFKLFPILLAMFITWGFCGILTVSNVLEKDSPIYTDANDLIAKSPWFRIPYPGQWGLPTVTIAAVLGMLAGIIASMIESIGDYYACANLAGAPTIPVHALNRGLFFEGIGSMIAGLFGSGNGTTSYSENIGAIGVTKVASRRVIQFSALIMLVFGVLNKFCAAIVSIPSPLIGGVYCAMFGMISAVGLSNLQYVNLNSPRNLFVLGVALLLGLAVPSWIHSQKNLVIVNYSETLDQLIQVLLKTSMLVGGLIGFFLDNTIPGTDEERGLIAWRKLNQAKKIDSNSGNTYNFPFGMNFISKHKIFKMIPICPTYTGLSLKVKTLFKKRCISEDSKSQDVSSTNI